MKVTELPKKSKIIFEGIVGSQAYNLHNEDSDVDIKGVFVQSNEDILSNKYIPQVDVDADTVYYEIRRFLELVSVGNPNVLELLFLPARCVLQKTPEWEQIWSYRKQFLTKRCYNTFSGYAKSQLKKATGLNKKFNWEKDKIQRKDIIDFCNIVDRQSGLTYNLKDWLKEEELTQEQIGLVSIDGFRDCYKLYVDALKWVNDNHRFRDVKIEERGYRGIIKEDSNEPRLSEIEKYRINLWRGIIYWNREMYSRHCKNYREYQKWLKNRNENRVATNKKHGQQMDGKNIQHLVRLIMTAREIPVKYDLIVDRTEDREYLLSIRRGEVDLKQILDEWGKKAEDMEQLYDNSMLNDEVSAKLISILEIKIRNYGI